MDKKMDGQQSFSFDDEMNIEIVENNMKKELEEDVQISDEVLGLIRGKNFKPEYFHQQYEDHTNDVLQALLAMQSNDFPLKKGGEDIVFRSYAIILQNRQQYSIPENTLLDVLLGWVSSHPEELSYQIPASAISEMMPYEDKSYVYKLLSTTANSLNKNPFKFEIESGKKGKKLVIEFQWNEVLIYNNYGSGGDVREDEGAYLSFVPTKFFRMLALSSGVMHGSYYKVSVSSQIQGNYTRNLYYFLEGMVDYKAYEKAIPGLFRITLEELRYILNYPLSYRPTDIKRFILEPSMREINSLVGGDFAMEYEMVKTNTGRSKKTTHVLFRLKKIILGREQKLINEKKTEDNITFKDAEEIEMMRTTLKTLKFKESEQDKIVKVWTEKKRSYQFFSDALGKTLSNPSIINKTAYLCALIENGLLDDSKLKEKGRFFKMESKSQYDFEQLEKEILANQ